jgi:hypothetical protein
VGQSVCVDESCTSTATTRQAYGPAGNGLGHCLGRIGAEPAVVGPRAVRSNQIEDEPDVGVLPRNGALIASGSSDDRHAIDMLVASVVGSGSDTEVIGALDDRMFA